MHSILFIFFQRIRATIDEKDQKQLLMDLDVVMRCNECPYIVKFYGALFKEVPFRATVAVFEKQNECQSNVMCFTYQ